jgi:hypothetical protein
MSLDNAKNFAKVTVSTGYDAVATTIVLTTGHGAKLPTAPFNAVWWNATDFGDPADDPNAEIIRVTNISTDTLTVTRAQESTSAATHNTSAKTYKMMAGLTAKVINTDLAGGLTKAGPYLTDGTHYYIPHMMYQAVTPDNVTFAWNNQGSATETALGKALVLFCPVQTENPRIREKSRGAATQLVMAFSVTQSLDDIHDCGMMIRDSVGGKYIYFLLDNRVGPKGLSVFKYSAIATFSAIAFNATEVGLHTVLWLRFRISGGNIIFQFSFDGTNYVTVFSETTTTFFANAPDKWGYFANVNNGSAKDGAYITLLSFEES